ncbi:hypothetical protein [Ancylobacter sp. SL191]|uniref:hypothetical protein n=1 Tax=Ancylobacter sp. SL191 TaxID=2995166 RepID=UPI00226DD5F7|nr:hypothetical protein [Ancylobacter sp. SL191]WAC26449.1 hypothetical protein OU996_15690 [Ancylobacter sp. SL191]
MSDPILLEIMEKLGELRADVRNLKDDAAFESETGAAFRREVREEIGTVKAGVADVKHAIQPVAEAVEQHAATLAAHGKEVDANKLFRDRIGAVIAVGAAGVSTVFGGVSYLVWTYFNEIWTFLRGLISRS